MTKEGRFLRLRFKTGAVVDVVLAGSIASGVANWCKMVGVRLGGVL
jgi:hypothetical protein